MRTQKYSWKAVKAAYLNHPQVMWEMIQFRKETVDGLLKTLNGKYDDKLVAKSVGSTNLTSDYDITLSTKDGTGEEIDAIKEFNATIKAQLKVPPGVCFDTNLYAKDFLKVDDNILDGTRNDKEAIATITGFLEEDQSDQDVAALTKQRQYLGAEGWDDYKDGILKALPKEAQAASRQQFEEAETLFITKCVAKTQPLVPKLEKFKTDPKLGREITGLLDEWKRIMSMKVPPASLETLCDEIAEFAHEHAEAEMLETNNDVYMEKMSAVRDIQKQHQGLEAVLKKADTGSVDFNEAMPFLTEEDQFQLTLLVSAGDTEGTKKYLAGKVDALKARAKKEVGEANFFASEAYLSEGPLQHIVNGKQSNNPEVFNALKPEHFLGSINEQFGDFMKDVGHYKSNDAEGFCQTSQVHRTPAGRHRPAAQEAAVRYARPRFLEGHRRRYDGPAHQGGVAADPRVGGKIRADDGRQAFRGGSDGRPEHLRGHDDGRPGNEDAHPDHRGERQGARATADAAVGATNRPVRQPEPDTLRPVSRPAARLMRTRGNGSDSAGDSGARRRMDARWPRWRNALRFSALRLPEIVGRKSAAHSASCNTRRRPAVSHHAASDA